MIAEVDRSGLVEARHEVSVAAIDVRGRRFVGGDVDRPFFLRSSAKPFQATVSVRLGGALPPELLAVACASHAGDPVHIALVRAILDDAGLDERALRCPPAWPNGTRARRRLLASGHIGPRPLWHNCSGKHAAMLRACVAQGWDTETYLELAHPLQQAIRELMVDVGGEGVLPVGVDGCGVPVFRSTTDGLAGMFSSLVAEERFASVVTAMRRHPALVSGVGRADALVATWLGGVAKHGAEGCIGVAIPGVGSLAVKVWDGAERAEAVTLLAALDRLGWVSGGARGPLERGLARAVLGGGRRVGTVRISLDLEPV
jgi:L-asparaginase II